MFIALVLVSIVAVAGVLVVFRWSEQPSAHLQWQMPGYPPDRFPIRELVQDGPLAAFGATQMRLLAMYRQLPSEGDTTAWLRIFLCELRAIMDNAYYVAQLTDDYERSPIFDWLVVELQQIETEIAGQIAQYRLLQEGNIRHEILAGRLASLRMYARELTSLHHGLPLVMLR
jgi:hypothetical protein